MVRKQMWEPRSFISTYLHIMYLHLHTHIDTHIQVVLFIHLIAYSSIWPLRFYMSKVH